MSKIFLGTPMYGGQATTAYIQGLTSLISESYPKQIDIQSMFLTNESLITRARNTIVHEFLYNSDATHLLFIDADIGFYGADIFKMLDADKDVICGLYPKKYVRWDNIKAVADKVKPEQLCHYGNDYCVTLWNNETNFVFGEEEPVSAKEAGTGCMLIKREVFQKLHDKQLKFKAGISVPPNINTETLISMFFESAISPDDGKIESEDYNFCRKWREAGGEIHVAPWTRLCHVGQYVYG